MNRCAPVTTVPETLLARTHSAAHGDAPMCACENREHKTPAAVDGVEDQAPKDFHLRRMLC